MFKLFPSLNNQPKLIVLDRSFNILLGTTKIKLTCSFSYSRTSMLFIYYYRLYELTKPGLYNDEVIKKMRRFLG